MSRDVAGLLAEACYAEQAHVTQRLVNPAFYSTSVCFSALGRRRQCPPKQVINSARMTDNDAMKWAAIDERLSLAVPWPFLSWDLINKVSRPPGENSPITYSTIVLAARSIVAQGSHWK